MNVVHTVASLNPAHGGPSRSVPRLVQALNEAGVEAGLFVREEDGRTGLDRAMQGHTNLLHDHGLWLPSNHAAAVHARRAHVPRIVSPRGMLSAWALRHRRWKKRAAWWLYQQRDLATATVLHATSEDERDEFRQAGLRQPVAVIPNGVEIPESLPIRQERATRQALFLSRLHPIKGLLTLVQAWLLVRPVGWDLLIAGPDEGGHRAEVEAAVQAAGLEGVVRFVGPVADEDKWTAYRNADVFVLPTFSENFGLVIAEALASGVPVITTKAAPWRGLETHRCGWWVDVGVEPLAAALREATALSDEQRDEMGLRGRAWVEEAFSWSHVATQMREVYAWMLHGGTPPVCIHPG